MISRAEARFIARLTVLFLGSFLIAALVAVYLQYATISRAFGQNDKNIKASTYGLGNFADYMVIHSIDPATGTLDVTLERAAAARTLNTTLYPSEYFYIEQQDAIMSGTTMVGMTEAKEIAPADVRPEMRGIGILATDDQGRYQIKYLLVGDPFPRP
mgnify:CR=1 FL=1